MNSKPLKLNKIVNKHMLAMSLITITFSYFMRTPLLAEQVIINGGLTVEEETELKGSKLTIGGGVAGANSVAIGASSNAGDNAFSFLGNSLGEFSVALGPLCNASGKTSRAFGSQAEATADFSTAIGVSVLADADSSAAIGSNLRAQSYRSIVLGSGNLGANPLYDGGNPLDWEELDDLFVLGNSHTGYSNAITTFKNGQTKLTNKAWKAETSDGTIEEDEVPTDSVNSSNGQALVVEGHADFEGNIEVTNGTIKIMKPAGDIPMFGTISP